ncbi:hypothetical protein GJ744_004608 [Endocarpon pusillum]|uniref:SET domain-containing protein n=1 Tax=Endocarpon pusillum TaxID=364733 RepID=A0A8H7E5P4_9EURO|nr:hypothetical protein GJ744_004608 [Endocarpon pusillum]
MGPLTRRWFNTADSRQLIHIISAGQKGLGVFAKVNIPRGTRIIAEPPLMKLDQVGNSITIWKAFNKLKPLEKEKYLELHHLECDKEYELMNPALEKNRQKLRIAKVLAIYRLNKSICHAGTIVVSYLPSRFNHSCLPNTKCAENPNLGDGVSTIHAVRDIKEGEELTYPYVPDFNRPKDQRQGTLYWQGGFLCLCEACSDSDFARSMDHKRQELSRLDQRVSDQEQYPWTKVVDGSSTLKDFQQMEVLQKDLGLHEALGVTYGRAARYCCSRLQDSQLTLEWASKTLANNRVCLGADHPICKDLVEMVSLLESAVRASGPFPSAVAEFYSLPLWDT